MKYLIELFPQVLNTSLTTGIVILFILAARLLLKKAPKIFSYALWGIVLMRLLVPVTLTSPVSIVPEVPELMDVQIDNTLPDIPFETYSDRLENQYHRENTAPDEVLVQVGHAAAPTDYLTLLWLAGIAVMLLYSIVSYFRLRGKLKVVVPLGKRVFLADDIASPFVLGLLRPKIYLPGGLGEREQSYILLHEQHHIRRLDHIVKALAFLALCIHWFNPLVWAAFILASKDMEMSCDEAVIKKLGEDIRADYSASLLTFATGRRIISGTPLAFGEGNTKGRIRNLANWKKPVFWVIILAAIVCIVLTVCLITDPIEPDIPTKEQVYLALSSKDEDFDATLIGQKRKALLEYWGEPDGSLFGMWGDIWELKGAANIYVYYDSDGAIETVKAVPLDAVDVPYAADILVLQSYSALTEDPQDLYWNKEPVFQLNFAENFSFSHEITLTEDTPYWSIYVFNTGAHPIRMEVEGEVYTISEKTKAVFSSHTGWEAGTYPVCFSSSGMYPMEGMAVCITASGQDAAADYSVKPQMSFAGLEPQSTQVDMERIIIGEDGADLDYHLTYGSQDIILEIGLISEDGTRFAKTIEHGSGVGTFKDIPAGNYQLFVSNIGFQNQGDLPGIAVKGGAMVCTLR